MSEKKTSSNGKKAAVAVAGIVTAGAVLFGAGDAPPSDGDFAGSMTSLEQAVDNLVDKSEERGMALPQSPGINDVTAGMDGMAPTRGTTRAVKVSSGGDIAKGDYIKVCEEVAPGEAVTFAEGEMRIVATASNGQDGIDCEDRTEYLVSVLFTLGGNTYLRVVEFEDDGSMAMSNTLTIAQGVELGYTDADMAMDHHSGRCVVVYNKGGDGWISQVQYTAASQSIELTWSTQWRQGGDPKNICLAYDTFSGFACVCSTVADDEGGRYAELAEMAVLEGGVVMAPALYPLTAENCPSLYGIDYSTGINVGGGWDISYATNWYYDMMARRANGEADAELTDNDVAGFVVLISYPKAEAGGRGLITVDHDAELNCRARNYVEHTAAGYSSADTVAIDMEATRGELGYVAMTDVVHSVYLGEAHYLFIETYGVQKAGSKPVCYMRGRPEEVYASPLENISYALMAKEAAIGYVVDGAAYVQILEVQRAGSVFGPAVQVAEAMGYAGVVPVSGNMAAYIYADAAGGYIVPITKIRVVAKEAMAAWATGTALEDGTAGESIRADLNYWPDEQW